MVFQHCWFCHHLPVYPLIGQPESSFSLFFSIVPPLPRYLPLANLIEILIGQGFKYTSKQISGLLPDVV